MRWSCFASRNTISQPKPKVSRGFCRERSAGWFLTPHAMQSSVAFDETQQNGSFDSPHCHAEMVGVLRTFRIC